MFPQENHHANDDADDEAEVVDEATEDPVPTGVAAEPRTFQETNEFGDLFAEELSEEEVEALRRNLSAFGFEH